MGISCKTGWHLSWLACLLLVCFGPGAKSASADELSNSVTSELLNLSRAFRSLDQSFQYRGMSSRFGIRRLGGERRPGRAGSGRQGS
jgi:hypothetical protein